MLGETSKEYDATYGESFDISTQSSSVENDPGIKVEARGNHGRQRVCLRRGCILPLAMLLHASIYAYISRKFAPFIIIFFPPSSLFAYKIVTYEATWPP